MDGHDDATANAHATTRAQRSHLMVGHAEVRRVGGWSFPVHELRQDDEVLARLGRGGWFTISFGRGQRIELADGARWTIRSIGAGGTFAPIIVDSVGRRVTTAGVSHGTYGINGRDYAFVMYPEHRPRFGRPDRWILRRFERELAVVTRYPASIDAVHPVHLGAVFMAFVLVRYGLPEESMPRVPALRWGA